MTFHLAALLGPVPAGGISTEIPPIADSRMVINPATNRFWASDILDIFGVYCGLPNIYPFASCSALGRTPNYVWPLNSTVLPPSPPNVAVQLEGPLKIPAATDVVVTLAQLAGPGPQDGVVVLWCTSEGLQPRPAGEVITMLGLFSGTPPAARQWGSYSFTSFSTSLPPGEWAIVGCVAVAPNGIAFRMVIEDKPHRPGGLSMSDFSSQPHSLCLSGTLGEWGRFTAPTMLRFEFLANVADAVTYVYLQVVRIERQQSDT